MKRVLLLSLFCCLGFAALSQPTTVRIFATGAAGSYITGSATSGGARNDGDIVSGIPSALTTSRGYAVFDLAGVPPTANVSGVVTQFYINNISGTLTPSGWNVYGYSGDLSTVTVPAVLYTSMTAGTSLTTAGWPTVTGLATLASTPSAVTFVGSNIGNKVSWCWTSSSLGTRTYYITGETGTGTAAGHAPYIDVTYTCPGISGVAAGISPSSSICPGSTFTLTATGSAGLTYTWQGPSGYAHTGTPATITANSASEGTYTLTATNAAGCKVITTTTMTLATVPTITATAAAMSICEGATATWAATPTGGMWSSGAATIATVNPSTGIVNGLSHGVANITYTNAAAPGCSSSLQLTVNAAPVAISPTSPQVCIGSTLSLSNASTGGTWSVAPITVATVSSTTGVITGLMVGTATVTYSNNCGSQATAVITVNPLPGPISGPTHVCEGGFTMTLSNTTTPGGTWSTSDPLKATASTIDATNGQITGVNDGSVTITYTSALGCNRTYAVIVDPAPNPITGVLKHCFGTATTLSNSILGGTWSSGSPTVATPLAPGVFFGSAPGYSIISYTNACGVATAIDTVVGTPPPFVGGDTVCEGGTLVLANAALGGTWSSSNPSKATVLPGSGVVSGISAGVVNITYTLPPGCARSQTVEVITGPPAITGGLNVCPGKTTALANASAGGTWLSGSPAVATVGVTSGVVTGITPNTAMITYTDIHRCIATAMVIVDPLPPAILGDSILCPSIVDTLYNPAMGGTWSSLTPGIATIGATTGIINTVSGGTAIIRYTFTGTGCYINKSVTVHAVPAPTVTYNYFTNTFEATPGFNGYQWYNSLEGLIADATHNTTAAQINATYYVKVIDSNGCVGTSNGVVYNTSMLNVNSIGASSFKIYPNPSNGVVYIDAPVKVNVVITDLSGRKEMEGTAVNKLDISKLTPGLYMITVEDVNGVKLGQQKLIKE